MGGSAKSSRKVPPSVAVPLPLLAGRAPGTKSPPLLLPASVTGAAVAAALPGGVVGIGTAVGIAAGAAGVTAAGPPPIVSRVPSIAAGAATVATDSTGAATSAPGSGAGAFPLHPARKRPAKAGSIRVFQLIRNLPVKFQEWMKNMDRDTRPLRDGQLPVKAIYRKDTSGIILVARADSNFAESDWKPPLLPPC